MLPFSRKGIFGRHAVQLVGIANHREQLEQKKCYCLLTNQRALKSSQVLRHCLQRAKIEWFFKMMKTYGDVRLFSLLAQALDQLKI